MNKELEHWAEENDDAIVNLYFNCDSDLYDCYDPYSGTEDYIHTDEQMQEYQENFDGDIPESFLEDVYVTLGERCPKCLMKEDNCKC